MQSLLEKPASIRSANLYHTHMHMALMPQRMYMYAGVPRCMPIARFGLIYNTMPSHIRKSFSKSLVNVRVRGMYVRVHACVCACHKGQIESLLLST